MLALLLAAMLLAGMASTALAYDEEIIFQDFPWGSDHASVAKLIEKKGVPGSKFVKNGDWILDMGILQNDENDPFSYDYGNYYRNTVAICVSDELYPQIAGYDVKLIKFNFLYGADEKGLNEHETQLLEVEIQLKDLNTDDLLAKLSSIYGEPKEWSEGYYWLGANDTGVFLRTSWGQLIYGKTDAAQKLQSLLDTINGVAEPTADPNNSNGL